VIPVIGGALQVIYEDVRAHMAARMGQTIQEIADNVGEDRLAARMKDPVHQALFAKRCRSRDPDRSGGQAAASRKGGLGSNSQRRRSRRSPATRRGPSRP
jgi:hypothetical protein